MLSEELTFGSQQKMLMFFSFLPDDCEQGKGLVLVNLNATFWGCV